MGGRSSKQVMMNVLNEMTAESIMSSASECVSPVNVIQEQNYKTQIPIIGDRQFIQNAGCLQCEQNWSDMLSAYRNYKGRAEQLGIPATEPAPDDGRQLTAFTNATNFANNPCNMTCAALVASNNSQSSTLNVQLSCSNDEEFRQQLATDVGNKVEQKLTEQKDVLGVMVAAASKALGSSNEEKIKTDIVNIVKNSFTVEKVTSLVTRISLRQSMTVAPRPATSTEPTPYNYSVGFTNNRQQSQITMIAKMVAETKIFTKLDSKLDNAAFQSVTDKNDTIGDIAREIDKTVDSLAGTAKTVLFIVIGVGAVMVMLVVYLLFRRNTQKKAIAAATTPPPQQPPYGPPPLL